MPYHSHAKGKHLHGLHAITAYRNRDGKLSDTNCGLAAAATALRHKHLFTDSDLSELESRFPPDILFGRCGTSKDRVCEILDAYKCRWREVEDKQALERAIKHCHPVIVMLSLPNHTASGHWMVAYAYDRHHVHLTNYVHYKDQMSWKHFEESWDSWLGYWIDMDNTGIEIS